MTPDDDLLPVPREELVDSDRFRFIEPLESRLGWEEMRDFAGRVGDRRIRELLEVALAGKGAFGRFKAVLADHPEERARWHAEHDQHMAGQARAWLDREGIAWTARKVAQPDAGVTGAPVGFSLDDKGRRRGAAPFARPRQGASSAPEGTGTATGSRSCRRGRDLAGHRGRDAPALPRPSGPAPPSREPRGLRQRRAAPRVERLGRAGMNLATATP